VVDVVVEHFWVLVPDMILVMMSEFVVDWVKHAFITKFNEIPSEVVTLSALLSAHSVSSSPQCVLKSPTNNLSTVLRMQRERQQGRGN